MKRPPRAEPARCVCEPGGNAHAQHAKPGKKVAAHFDTRCPHSELRNTTKRAPKQKTVHRLRIR